MLQTLRGPGLWLVCGFAVPLIGCQPELPEFGEPQTSEEWVAASARVHDPQGHWPLFAAELTVGSFGDDGRFWWQEELYVDLSADTFRRTIIVDGYLLEQTAGPTGRCRARWAHPDPSASQLPRLGLLGDACAAVTPPRQFNEFLTGLPMSALAERTRFGESPFGETLGGETVTVVTLSFEDDPGGQQWYLYIATESKVLKAARFDFSDGSGEWIYYSDLVSYSDLLLATRRRITKWPSDVFVVEQRIMYEALPE